MSCGRAEMPETGNVLMSMRNGMPKWKTPSRGALRRRKVVVCGNCWRIITWEAWGDGEDRPWTNSRKRENPGMVFSGEVDEKVPEEMKPKTIIEMKN
jgi:hypothetical protein